MKVLFVSVEVSPFAKVGGLADVASSLPKAILAKGHDIRIAMPAYGMILHDKGWKRKRVLTDLPVRINDHWEKLAFVDLVDHDGVPVYLIGTDEWFGDATESELLYAPGVDKYLFFSEAVLQVAKALKWMPDVIHCNDWHTGFIPVLMREKHPRDWNATGTVFTIHNFAYQGEFSIELLDELGLPRSLYNAEDVEAWGRVNFLKSGCTFADQVNTVSRRYAKEIQTPAFGCRLEGLMKYLSDSGRLSGILNGIDKGDFSPEADPRLPASFSAAKPEGKQLCREKLLRKLDLRDVKTTPILGVVSRLSEQKGLDILVAAAERILALPVTIVVQGLGDPWLVSRLRDLQRKFPTGLRFVEEFDEATARLVYAGSDFFGMPSRFEPCGLGQMIALRYGAIPIVRHTGGLADTISENENGFVFEGATPEELLFAVARATQAFKKPARWAKFVKTALECDFSWNGSSTAYEDLYRRALAARESSLVERATA